MKRVTFVIHKKWVLILNIWLTLIFKYTHENYILWKILWCYICKFEKRIDVCMSVLDFDSILCVWYFSLLLQAGWAVVSLAESLSAVQGHLQIPEVAVLLNICFLMVISMSKSFTWWCLIFFNDKNSNACFDNHFSVFDWGKHK